LLKYRKYIGKQIFEYRCWWLIKNRQPEQISVKKIFENIGIGFNKMISVCL